MRAFTLIETILVIALFLIAGVTTAWFTTNFFFERQTVLAANMLRSSLVQAQLYALSGRGDSDWGVTERSGEIILFAGSSYAGRETAWDERIPLPERVTLSGFSEVIFTQTSGNATPGVFQVTGNSRTINMSVNRKGAITEP